MKRAILVLVALSVSILSISTPLMAGSFCGYLSQQTDEASGELLDELEEKESKFSIQKFTGWEGQVELATCEQVCGFVRELEGEKEFGRCIDDCRRRRSGPDDIIINF